MSYDSMDHAGWVESNRDAAIKQRAKRRTDKEGRPVGWHAMPAKLNHFQRRVMDICGVAMGGIYNAPIVWDALDWGGNQSGQHVYVPLEPRRSLATHDGSGMTTLVMLCHMARIRLDVEAGGFGRLGLGFWSRSHQGGGSERHPDLLERVREIYRRFPKDHGIRYLPERDDPLPPRWVATLERLSSDEERVRAELARHVAEENPKWMKPIQAATWRVSNLSRFAEQLQRDAAYAAELATKLGSPEAARLAAEAVNHRSALQAELAPHLEAAKAAVPALEPAEAAQ